jgi:hypothetical protein
MSMFDPVSDHVAVRSDELVAHAGTVRGAGDRVGAEAAAGRAVRAGPEAYGQLCVMIPAMLGALQDAVVDGIASAADALYATAGRLTTTAQQYAATDGGRSQAFDEIRARL